MRGVAVELPFLLTRTGQESCTRGSVVPKVGPVLRPVAGQGTCLW